LALRETPERGHPYDVWVPCPMRSDESEDDRAVWDKLNFGGEAPALFEKAEEQLGLPMPLNATQVRRLPFGHLLDLATREEARRLNLSINRFSDLRLEPHSESAGRWFDEHTDRSTRLARAIENARSGQPRGKAKDAPTLERIASLYEGFYKSGSNSPTRDVAEALRMSRSTTAKRVMECRKAGLLAPTSRGKAGGMPDEPEPPNNERSTP